MSAKAVAKGAAVGLGLVASAAFIGFFPAWLMRSKGYTWTVPTAAMAVAKPNFAARDALAYALIELGYACQARGVSEQDCKTVYDRSAAEARR